MMNSDPSSSPAFMAGCGKHLSPRNWNVNWPINCLALSALYGVGMSDREIAGYYRVSPDEVGELRETYRIR